MQDSEAKLFVYDFVMGIFVFIDFDEGEFHLKFWKVVKGDY